MTVQRFDPHQLDEVEINRRHRFYFIEHEAATVRGENRRNAGADKKKNLDTSELFSLLDDAIKYA